ncbi:hypothetical protein [Haloplanus sp.]|uniref:hypothetical protein n=1 Tax=Haloplanus sp. TaxID=1961696 RepID=UPI0026189AD1|nr:hypothetical protein [Haloplanus sp.]
MQRRKFIAGVGSLAAGAAAVTGTGAFTSVSANRSIAVEVADDANAFLGLEAADSANADAFVTNTGGTIAVDVSNTDAGGQGINRNAATAIDDLFVVTNQGTSDVFTIIRDDTSTTANGAFYAQVAGKRLLFQSPRSSGTFLDSTLQTVLKIPVGESVTVGLEQDEPNTGRSYEGRFAVVAADNLDDVGSQTSIDADGQFGRGRGQDLRRLDGTRISP